jgi:tetratricopeptide (TPR) repeat protein
MESFAVWKSRPVFISSTFRDMNAERDYLRDKVFLELEDRLKERFHHLDFIDLRWGVETKSVDEEHAKELLVLKVCLSEIERSRPFLIVLIGDRYGWIPPQERMKAAAEEAGYAADLTGKSVTALEIEFGVLDSPDQRKRSRFYFREPLPYDMMPDTVAAIYSDEYTHEPGSKDAHDRLIALKDRIERTMPDRVHRYKVTWDNDNHEVTGLEEWGNQVLEELWCDLEEETREYLQKKGMTWQEQEGLVLEQFRETTCRDFKGRKETINELLTIAKSPLSEKALYGACVSGLPGSGKSALFSQMVTLLREEDIFVLAHAAGISSRASQVDTLLRRWIWEMTGHLQIEDPSDGIGSREDLEKAFATMLSRVAAKERVVCLIDALNQFERSPSARYLTWLPKLWPRNARLIATAIPGSETEALKNKNWMETVPLPLLSEIESKEIAETVCRRYRKTANEEVLGILLAKKLPDRSASAGNPLWLEMAIEELLLLDADDFGRMDKEFAGTPEQKLHALMMDVAGKLPSDIESLYAHMLQRTEDVYGASLARNYACLTAITRTGLREQDLEKLLPKITGEPWNELGFAALRRGFRAHLVQRGAYGQWDFTHAQMRMAIGRRSLSDNAFVRSLHTAIADHFQSLPQDDLLRQTELMFHLIGTDDLQRCAKYFSGILSAAELNTASKTLAEHIAGGEAQKDNLNLRWAISLLHQDILIDDRLYLLCNRFNFNLMEAMNDSTGLKTRIQLTEQTGQTLSELRKRDRDNEVYAQNLSVSYSKLGDLNLTLGDTQRALEFHNKALKISEELREWDRDNAEYARDMSVSCDKLGDLNLKLGDTQRALEFYNKALKISEELRERDRDNADYARGLSVSYIKLGDLNLTSGDTQRASEFYNKALKISEELRERNRDNARYARDISVSCDRLGDLNLTLGDTQRASEFYNKALKISEELRERDRDNADYARDISVSCDRIGDLNLKLGDTQRALEFYNKQLQISEELRERDRDNAEYARGLSMSCEKLGDLNLRLGDTQRALEFHNKALKMREVRRERDRDNVDCARDLSVSYNRLGDLNLRLGDMQRALEFHNKAMKISEELRERDRDNARYARDISVSCERLGDLNLKLGDTQRALEFYNKALKMREDLRERDRDNVDYAWGLSISWDRLGDLNLKLGDTQRALAFHNKALKISEELRERNRDNAEYARGLSVSCNKLGDLNLKLGDTQRALEFYNKVLEISEELWERDRDNANYVQNLSMSYDKLGDLNLRLGDTQRALEFHNKALKISEEMRERDCDNAEYARNLSISYSKLGDLNLKLDDTQRALEFYNKALKISEELREQDRDNAEYARGLVVSFYNIAKLHQQSDASSKAQDYWKRCRDALLEMKSSGMFLDTHLVQLLEWLSQRN